MYSNAKISIVVPIYKVEKFLKRCIESIVNQTYKNLEIILVDDGSPDLCGKICDEYKKTDDRIIVIHQQNMGLSDARNSGITFAKGEYIAFVDSDDYIKPQMIETLYKNLCQYDAQISCCGHIDIYEDQNTVEPIFNKRLIVMNSEEALSKFLFTHIVDVVAWNKLYDIKLFENVRYESRKLFEDHFTTYKLLDKAKTIVHTTEPFYYYCKRHDSIGGVSFSEKNFQLKDALDIECSYIKIKYPRISKTIDIGYIIWLIVIYDKMILSNVENKEFLLNIRKLILKSFFQIIISRDITASKKMQIMLLIFNKKIYYKMYCWYIRKYR